MENIAIAILAGGRSRRMGRDKAALPWDGATLLERLAGAAVCVGVPVLVVGRQQPEDWGGPAVTFLPDRYPDLGPMGGVLTALESGSNSILAVACDMPYLDARALEWLLGAARDLPTGAPGLAGRNGDQIEPLFAVYRQDLKEAMAARIAAGRLSMNGLIADSSFVVADVPAEIRAALVNINTPEEWRDLDRKDKL
ncbi:molybdenum cofactor guanylyltransferase [Capsulimonas corticalis]|nr:molybdenum cofactor guanylyltransferase [Capsulimonas corticalis]